MNSHAQTIRHAALFLAILAVLLPLTVCAKEIHFEASVERNVIALGQGARLNLAFEGTKDVPRPGLSAIDGFQTRYLGPSTMMSIVNGRMSSSITHVFTLIPLKTGTFTIGPFSFDYNGDTYTAGPVKLEVVDSAAGNNGQGSKQKTESMDLKDRVFVVMKAGKHSAYINEAVPLTVRLYVHGLAVRDIQYPELEQDGFSMEEFGKPKQYQENRKGTLYDVIEFNTRVFGTRQGKFTIGPAGLKANILVRSRRRGHSRLDDFFGRGMLDDFFGGYETYPLDLKSGKVSFTVLPFPEAAKPDGFSGAIGDFDLAVTVSPSQVKEGDPVTVKMVVSGKGNFNTVSVPKLKSTDGFKVYEPQVTQQGDRKIFEQILMPLSESIGEIPPVTLSFFNPDKGKYTTVSKGNIPITVVKREKEEKITMVEASPGGGRIITKEKLGKDIVYIKESPGTLNKAGGYLYRSPAFLLLQTVPFILFVSAMVFQRRRDRLRTDSVYARRLSAPRKARKGITRAQAHLKNAEPEEFYGSVYKTLQEYIGDRYHLPAAGITADIIDAELKSKGIDSGILDMLKNIFKECDAARYAPAGLAKAGMEQTLQHLREVIDHMERLSA